MEAFMTNYRSDVESTEDTSVESHLDAIETVISSLDSYDNTLVNHGEEGHIWKFKYGTVDVFVQLTGPTDEDSFTVWSPVLQLPASNEAQLMRKLLEMNWSDTFEACFGILDSRVVAMATRSVADLSPGEISRTITIVATIADEYDEPLQAEFAATST